MNNQYLLIKVLQKLKRYSRILIGGNNYMELFLLFNIMFKILYTNFFINLWL